MTTFPTNLLPLSNIPAANKHSATKGTTPETSTDQVVETLDEKEFVEEHEEPKAAVGGNLADGLGRPGRLALGPVSRYVPPTFADLRAQFMAACTELNTLERALEEQ